MCQLHKGRGIRTETTNSTYPHKQEKCENYVKSQECVENKMKCTYKDAVCSGLQATTKAKNRQKPTKYSRTKLNVTGVLKPSKYSNYGHKLKK